MSNTDTLLNVELPGIKNSRAEKSARYLILAIRSCSSPATAFAFDCVMPNGIPRKGEVLTQISHFWFDMTEKLVPNHRLVRAGESFNIPALVNIPAETKAALARRAMIVKKAKPSAVECIVRGYLADPVGKNTKQPARFAA